MKTPSAALFLVLATACGGPSASSDSGSVTDIPRVDSGPDAGSPLDAEDAGPSDPGAPADVPCLPDCTNRRCGDDGCGGLCGTCPYPEAHPYDTQYGSSPVGSFPAGASPFGVLDLAGNVTEWTRDVYGSDFYCMGPDTDTYKDFPACPDGAAPYQVPWQDPVSQAKGVFRVLRGGEYTSFPGDLGLSLRCSDRWRWSQMQTRISFGFRCCGTSTP